MSAMLTDLSRAIEGVPVVALLAAFAWGILSVVLSPCHLASLPIVVGFVGGEGRTTVTRAFAISTLFALGILATIAGIGLLTAVAGRVLGDVGPFGNYVVAAIFFAFGLHLLDVLPLPALGRSVSATPRRGLLAALLLGLGFGLALGPCTFAFIAPALGVAFKVAGSSLAYGLVLLGAFGLGHCAVIVLAGTSTNLVQHYLNWSESTAGAVRLRRACGLLVLLGGLYLIYTA